MALAIVYTEIGPPSVLRLEEVPDPVAGPGQLLVRLRAAGVNPIDAKLRGGVRPSEPITAPRRVGFDGAGVVEALGAGVTGFAVGDRVVVEDSLGTYATLLAVDAHKAFALPDAVGFAEAAGIPIPAGTAFQSLRSLGVGDGDVLLVHGGTGAVGQLVVQFAIAAGAQVVATGSPARHEELRELGALPVAYGEGLTERIRAAAPGAITVGLDCVGTDEALQSSLELVADRERIATIVRGPDAAGLGIRAFSGGSPEPLTAQELAWRAEAVPFAIGLVAEGGLRIPLGPQLPLAEAARAHELVESGRAGGKIVLLP